MGIKQIILLNSWRVDKSYWQSPVLEPPAIREQLILGLEQARDTILPRVELQQRFKAFVEDTLPAIAAGTCALVAHPGSSQPCPVNLQGKRHPGDRPRRWLYALRNRETDRQAGLSQVHLGDRPLRVETAVPALIGRLIPAPRSLSAVQKPPDDSSRHKKSTCSIRRFQSDTRLEQSEKLIQNNVLLTKKTD